MIEDKFPNGRPALEAAGVYMTDRDTVNNTERMKVTTCLNPVSYTHLVGSLIYITAGIAEESPLKVIKELTPFTLALVALVILLIFFPGLVTAFPNWVMS